MSEGSGNDEVKPLPSLEKLKLSEAEWRNKLSPTQYQILRCHGTDAPGTNSLVKLFPSTGYFACAGCDLPLYSSGAKFRDPGWPAWDKCFFSPAGACHVATKASFGGMEILCARCEGHLGHVFYGERHTSTNERH